MNGFAAGMARGAAAVIGVCAVAYLVTVLLWLVFRDIEAVRLSWSDCTRIGFGYVFIRIVDKVAWSPRRNT